MEIVIVAIILVAAIVMVCTNKVPLGCIGIFIMFTLALTGILPAKEAFKRFNETSVLLVASVFIFSGAFFGTGCSDIIGRIIYRAAKGRKNVEAFLIASIALIMIFASSVLPNTALTAAMIPVVIAAAQKSKVSRSRLLMTTALFANLGGSVTLLGSSTNLVGRTALEGAGLGTLTFFDFTLIGLPIALLCLVYYMLVYKRFIPERVQETEEVVNEEMENQKIKLNKKQLATFILFGIFVLSVIAESFFKTIPAYAVGLMCSAILVGFRIMDHEEFLHSLDLTTWIFIIGTLTLSDAFVATGLSDVITNFVVSTLGHHPSEFILITVLFVVGCVMTQFVTNTGTAGILCPVAVSIAVGLGADARAAVVAIIIACNSSFVTPMATPANLIVTGPGKLQFGDWVKVGLPMAVISYICCVTLLPLFFPMYA